MSAHPLRTSRLVAAVSCGIVLSIALIAMFGRGGDPQPSDSQVPIHSVAWMEPAGGASPTESPDSTTSSGVVRTRPAPEFVSRGVDWLVKAQHPEGGWGAGSHANQQIKDPHAVKVDPATTAFVASALLRYGHSPVSGEHKDAARRATEYLCGVVEEAKSEGPKITDLEGTQIQAKLGPLVDTAMTAQYLARVLAVVPKGDTLHGRVDKALDKCLAKLNQSQQKDGSWNVGGGWASVLQSSLGCSALEYAQAAGKSVDRDRLQQARSYQLGNVDAKSGTVKTEAAAGVALYAYNSSLRANAAQTKAAVDLLDRAKSDGKVAADAPLNEETLKKAGVKEDEARQLLAATTNVTAQVATLNGLNTYSGISAAGSLSPALPALASSPVPTTGPVGRPVAVPVEAVASADVSAASIGEPSGGLAAVKSGGGTLTLSGGATFTAGTDVSGGTLTVGGIAGSGAVPAGVTGAKTDEEALLAGFGNNGGEEFFSYMLASESMVILGEKDWAPWYDRMSGRLSKVQNSDGSWSGHHCITSPVFCTAAVVQTMTADRDAEMLARLAKEATAIAKVDAKK